MQANLYDVLEYSLKPTINVGSARERQARSAVSGGAQGGQQSRVNATATRRGRWVAGRASARNAVLAWMDFISEVQWRVECICKVTKPPTGERRAENIQGAVPKRVPTMYRAHPSRSTSDR